VYTPAQRLEQTLGTINSVKESIPNAEITLIEVSVPAVNNEVEAVLLDNVQNYVNLSADENIQFLQKNLDRKDVVKNLTEAIAIGKMVKLAKQNGWFEDSARIFKISGRYHLTENFDLQAHLDPAVGDRFVFRKRNLSQFRPIHTGVPLQLQTRMYSFTPKLIDRYIQCLETMVTEMQDYFNTERYIDIEHLWYKLLDTTEYVELDKIGVGGFIAPNGQAVND
jgi:hypothetical protein